YFSTRGSNTSALLCNFFHQFKNLGAVLFAKSHDLGAASLSLVRQPLFVFSIYISAKCITYSQEQ
ncbi:MAG: hypothetical protein UHK60_01475, partial [Acutalibacteraceae bacterium]|nr:hypothetical protein [Acutalibacteraceae bacterium]